MIMNENKRTKNYFESLLDDLGQVNLKIDFRIQSNETKVSYFVTI